MADADKKSKPKSEKAGKPGKPEKPDKVTRPQKSEKTQAAAKAQKSGKAERAPDERAEQGAPPPPRKSVSRRVCGAISTKSIRQKLSEQFGYKSRMKCR